VLQDPPDTVAALTAAEIGGAVLEEDVPEWLAWQLEMVDSLTDPRIHGSSLGASTRVPDCR
jgi:hypothetical protein